jgi:hypothetical protein
VPVLASDTWCVEQAGAEGGWTMMQGEAYRRLLWLAVLVVGLFGSADVVAECTGAQCCFDDDMRNIGRCHTKWGAPIKQVDDSWFGFATLVLRNR